MVLGLIMVSPVHFHLRQLQTYTEKMFIVKVLSHCRPHLLPEWSEKVLSVNNDMEHGKLDYQTKLFYYIYAVNVYYVLPDLYVLIYHPIMPRRTAMSKSESAVMTRFAERHRRSILGIFW